MNSLHVNKLIGRARPIWRMHNNGFHREVAPTIPIRVGHFALGAALPSYNRRNDPARERCETQQAPQ